MKLHVFDEINDILKVRKLLKEHIKQGYNISIGAIHTKGALWDKLNNTIIEHVETLDNRLEELGFELEESPRHD